MKYLSLFSGVGGFELGIQQAYVDTTQRNKERGSQEDKERYERQGFQSEESEDIGPSFRPVGEHNRDKFNEGQPTCIGFSEIDKYAIKVYQHHFPNHKAYGDITKINEKELPDFDLLVGGFPCQSFSIAGKRRGFEDTRGTMFFEIARIVREKQPRLLLLENVKGLLSHDKGQTFYTIISTLDELGYDIQWQVLNAKDFGVPQNRERVFIVGHLRGTPRPEVFPIGGQTKTTTETIFVDESQWRREGKLREYEGISPTLNTNGGGGHLPLVTDKVKIRRLTPLECERLMSFPDNWTNVESMSDTQRYKQCGNGVVSNVVEAVVSKMVY